MPSEEFVFKVKADFLGALAHPARLRLIELLRAGELPVGRLCARMDMPQPSVSKHLAILRQEGLVKTRHEGTTIHYGIRDPDVFRVLRPVSAILRKRMRESQRLLARLGEPAARPGRARRPDPKGVA